jgi:aryl-alcohol dehydrogenase-like predicted oxidoreductase
MKQRRFGKTGWKVSEVGYGMWALAGWSGSDETEIARALQRAVELGCNFFDTAWAYGSGKSEKILGVLLRDNPDQRLYVATKIPPKNFKWPAQRSFTLEESYPPSHIREYVDKSLENLGVECIDLIQFHTWNDDWAEDERWIDTIFDLHAEGKILGVGISINRWEPENGIKAIKTGHIDAVQVIYNIFDQNPEDQLFPVCKEMDVAVIARVPFDEGSLTGTLTKESRWPAGDWRNTYFVPENLIPTVERVENLKPLVPRDSTMADMALRFILNNPLVSTVIPGMRNIAHVESNLGASSRGPLSDELQEQLKKHRWDRRPTKWTQ